ncbi:mechanosensitive ion channel family protein [Xanthobacter sp. TB0139]|uniref:mechanosensitive ion channel family protein n=1 Tax=Xanthobacter sp. TB0139 TaxID=3459178 RepID=UPI0040394EEE
MADIERILENYPGLATGLWLVALILAALVVHYSVKFMLVIMARRLIDHAKFVRVRDIVQAGVIKRLSMAVPAMVIASWIEAVPGLNGTVASVVRHVAMACITLAVAMAIVAGLQLAGRLWQRRHSDSGRSVTGYVQVAAIVVYAIAAILMIAEIINRSPLILMSGLGALTAVLILVFQDTLLSLVASVELSSTDIVRVGDWIEMPSMNANGSVVEVSLYSVTVRNWDNTYTNFPVRKLASDPFKNWRGMTESGGRRICRSIPIDQSTVRFLSADELEKFSHMPSLSACLNRSQAGAAHPAGGADTPADISENKSRVTNLSLLRAYMEAYLNAHPMLHKDMTSMVRHLEPGPYGLPFQLYCFTSTTEWKAYEAIQADLFDHMLSMLAEFDLKVFQST